MYICILVSCCTETNCTRVHTSNTNFDYLSMFVKCILPSMARIFEMLMSNTIDNWCLHACLHSFPPIYILILSLLLYKLIEEPKKEWIRDITIGAVDASTTAARSTQQLFSNALEYFFPIFFSILIQTFCCHRKYTMLWLCSDKNAAEILSRKFRRNLYSALNEWQLVFIFIRFQTWCACRTDSLEFVLPHNRECQLS